MLVRFKLSTKLISAFIIVAAITCVVGIIGVIIANRISTSLEEVGERNLPATQALWALKGALVTSIAAEQALANPDVITGSARKAAYAAQEDEFGHLNEYRKEFERLPMTSAERKAWKAYEPLVDEWMEDHGIILELARQRDVLTKDDVPVTDRRIKNIDDQMAKMVFETASDLQNLNSHVDTLTEAKNSTALAARKTGIATAKQAGSALGGAVILGVILAVTFGILLSRSVARSLERIISGLREASESTSAASDQLASASQSVADGTDEQASGLEETSSALQQVTSQTQANADNSRLANQLTQQTKSSAEEGNSSMSELRVAMSEINESSEQVGRILKAIEEIAFQTNLLALNAAVEAARAGEHGKGFAVVAEEVRNLAQRAASSVKETAVLIDDSIAKAQRGAAITEEASGALNSITGGIVKVSELIAEISAASEEQASGVNQVNSAVTQMSMVTQQNATAAEETATAGEELSAQASHLKDMVGELIALVHGKRAETSQSSIDVFRSSHSPSARSHLEPNAGTGELPFDDGTAGRRKELTGKR